MLRRFAFVLVLGLQLSGPSYCSDEPNSAAAVDETLELAETILNHHVLPPTRQEMLLAAVRNVYREVRVSVPLDLSRRFSEAVSVDELRRIMVDQLDPLLAQGFTREETLAEKLLDGLFSAVPGEIRLADVDEERVAEQFRSNRYVGTGIALGQSPDRVPTMAQVIPGGPAHSVGALDGDRIESIDGESTEGMSIERVIELLRGPEGSDVVVTLRQPDDERSRILTITRGVVPLQSISGYEVFPAGDDAVVAYLRMDRLTASCVHELRQYREKLDRDGVHGLILDLRFAAPGRVHHAVLLADAFLDGGEIGRVRTLDGDRIYSAEPDELFPDLRIGVLVGRRTRGTVEWLAAALQDRGRAVIFGEWTPGETLADDAVSHGGGDQLLILPTALLERPSGRPLLRDAGKRPVDASVARRFMNRPGEENVDGRDRNPWGVYPDVLLPGRSGPELTAMPSAAALQLPNVTPRQSGTIPIPGAESDRRHLEFERSQSDE